MRRCLACGVLLLGLLAAAPVAADASLRAYASVLGQRSAELDDRVDAASALGRYFPVEGVDALVKALNDPEPAIREAAARALWTAALSDESGARAAVLAQGDRLRVALDDRSIDVAALAASALEAAGESRESLAEVRRDVLRARGAGAYSRFIAARGLIGLDPPAALAPVLVEWGADLYTAQATGRRGSIVGDLELLDEALARLLREGGADAVDALVAEAGTASPVTPRVLKVLATAKPLPAGWVDVLLAAVDSPHEPTRGIAWSLLGTLRAPAETARWVARATAALDDPAAVQPALDALREAAGCCTQPLERVAAIALDPPSDAARVTALQLLARASDATSDDVEPAVLAPAKSAALRVFAPTLAAQPRGDAFDAALGGLMFTERDDAARATLLATALRTNPDPAARIALIDALSPSGTRGAVAVEAVKPFVDSPDPATREAALRVLSSIAPAWRESAQRAAAPAARPVAVAAPGVRGVGLMAMMQAVRSADAAAIAKLVPREKANAPLVMPDGSTPGRAPLDTAIDHCGLPQIDTARLVMVVRTLLAQGADPERPGPYGDTPMTRAKYACPAEVMAVLAGG